MYYYGVLDNDLDVDRKNAFEILCLPQRLGLRSGDCTLRRVGI